MRRLWIIVAALMAFGALGVLAPAAGASAPAKPSSTFCTKVAKIGSGTSSSSSLAVGAQARKVAKQFKDAAKSAPSGKVKDAMNRIASFIGSLGTSDAAALAKVYSSKGFKTYTTDIGTYVNAVATCES